MLNWEFFSYAYPEPKWQTINKPLGQSELFLIESHSASPGGLILIRQEFDLPPYHGAAQNLYPDHDRYIVRLPIPEPLRTITGLNRKLSYKLSDHALLWGTGINMLIGRVLVT